MLRYICFLISVLFAFPVLVMAQDIDFNNQWRSPQGFTLGVNLAGPVNKAFDNDRTGISFLTRINLAEDLFFRGEAGFENVSFSRERYAYDSNGSFLKMGLELNVITDKEPGSNDHLLFGFHYGFAVQEHSASSFSIENDYWGDYLDRMGSNTLNNHWLELSGGPRTELFKNFYLSWAIHLRLTFIRSNPGVMKPYIIPGFGNGDNNLNGGFSYTLEYMIPWKK